jgi:serine/threonine protein kinase
MHCSRCGAEVQSTWKACPSCGLALAPTTPIQALLASDLTELDVAREALLDEYEILEELGRGGMAVVFRARERQLEREVAVKVLPMSLSFDEEFVARFEREARTAAQLEHPHIIPIYRVGKSGRISYFVMKYLRGKSLSALLSERGRLQPPEIRRLLIEAAGALGYAATRGIVHRDVKPDNFIFNEFGSCVVTDFGIAYAASGQRLTGTGMSIGTPHYMSPEQARAQPLDGRSDLYSLGIMAYQCLTGSVPYDGEDSFSIGYAHIMEPLPTPTLATAEERDLFRVIRIMIAKDPKDRYQSFEQVVEALEGEVQPTRAAPAVEAAQPPRPAPSITTQPTTPLPALSRSVPIVTSTPARTRPAPAPRRKDGALSWWALAVVVLGLGGVGAAWLYQVGPFAPVVAATTMAASLDSLPPVPSVGAAPIEDGTSPDSAGAVDSATPAPVARTPLAAAVPSSDSGSIRILGLPAGSTVLIDGVPAVTAVTDLPVGRHVIAITAPRHLFYADTLDIRLGELVEYQPVLTEVGRPVEGGQTDPIITRRQANCDEPGRNYNRNNTCYDVRPRPVGPTFVRVPADWNPMPSSSRLLIRVSETGRTLEVRRLRPSDRRDFEVMARQFAAAVEWRPATKDGRPVVGWTPWEFRPVKP